MGRNAEGSGAVNTKGKIAAIYSYSKTKGLFGGASVEGSVIVERQDANRLAYGGNPSSKQILSGAFGAPDWAGALIEEIQRSIGGRWQGRDQEGERGRMGWDSPPTGRDNNGSPRGGYAFGEGLGAGGSTPQQSGRRRAGSLFGSKDNSTGEKEKPPSRPGSVSRRSSSFNPFSSSGSSTPRRAPSSESYNAGLTWDSSGPINGYTTRSRSGSSARKPPSIGEGSRRLAEPPEFHEDNELVAGNDDLLRDWEPSGDTLKRGGIETSRVQVRRIGEDENDLLGTWDASANGLAASFARISTLSKPNGNRSRSNSKPTPFTDIVEDDPLPPETRSTFTKPEWDNRNGSPFSSRIPPTSPFMPLYASQQPARLTRGDSSGPNIPLKAGLAPSSDGYARAVALHEFKATDPGDLGMKPGQVVVVLDKVGDSDWWRGRGVDGREGIFPSNYVEVVEIPKELRGGVGRGDLRARIGSLDFD